MSWFWLNIPLGAVFFLATAGIPMWLVLRRPDARPIRTAATAGSTTAGSTTAGSTTAGSTTAGSTSAGSTSAGSTTAGSATAATADATPQSRPFITVPVAYDAGRGSRELVGARRGNGA